MAKFKITVSEHEQDWSADNPYLSDETERRALSCSEACMEICGELCGGIDTPGFGRGPISPLTDASDDAEG